MVLSIQNNNPGNLRPVGQNTGFQGYATPEEGLQAMRDDLLVKVSGRSNAMAGRFGQDYQPTLANVISTWAPPSENDTNNYIRFVSQKTGITPDTVLAEADIDKITPAMVEMEGGQKAVEHFFGQTPPAEERARTVQDIPDFVRVNAPDGSVIKFPSSMSQEDILAVMRDKFPATPAEETEKPDSEKNFFERVGEDIGKRVEMSQEIKKAYREGEQSAPETALQAFGKVGVGTLSDVIGEGLVSAGRGVKAVTPDIVEDAVAKGGMAALRTVGKLPSMGGGTIGEQIPGEVSMLAKNYEGFAEENPRAARNIEALANIAELVPIGKGAQVGKKGYDAAAPVAKKAVKETAEVAGKTATKPLVPKIADEMAPLINRARKDFDIPMRLDQVAPSRTKATVQKVSQAIPGSGADAFEDTQRKAWTKALAKTLGEDADDLSPKVVKKFRENNSKTFNDVLRDKTMAITDDDILKLNSLKDVTENTMGLTDRDAKILLREIDQFVDDIGVGEIDGSKIANIRSNLLDRSAKAGNASPIFSDMIDTLDDVIERGLSPEDVEKLSVARRHYRNYKTIQPLLEESVDGQVDPTKLLTRVKSNKFINASDKTVGDDDIIDLARIGKLMVKKGGSDTFDKTLLTGGSGLVGGGVAAGSAPATAVGAGTVVLGNRGLQKGIMQNQKLIDRALENYGKAPKKKSALSTLYKSKQK